MPQISAARKCPICSQAMRGKLELYDDRYGYPGRFTLESCAACGHRALLTDLSPDQLIRLYSDYYPRSSLDLEQYRPAPEVHGFKAWLNGERRSAYCWVPKGVRVLDIGCGFCESLGYHKARGCEVYGVEADENTRRVAERYGFQVQVGLFDADRYEEGFFDYVTMDQVIEHVSDPVATLKGVARVLKPSGSLILSTPNSHGLGARLFGRRWINWHAPYHIQHFSLASLTDAARQAGLTVERARTVTSSEWLHYQWIHLCLFPAMGVPSLFWAPNKAKSFRADHLLRLLNCLHRTKANHVVTRFLDMLGLGDNYQFFLRKNA
jgi:2-polyprenyl-3-methyl-5-hydroxy-6-metoxy-1,4-benzoquinol methylase